VATVIAFTLVITGIVVIRTASPARAVDSVAAGPTLQSQPMAAATTGDDKRQYLFALGDDGGVWASEQAVSDSTTWSDWYELGNGSFSGPPTAMVNAQGRIEVYAVGGDGVVWRMIQTGAGPGGWWGWHVGGTCCIKGKVSVTLDRFNRLNIFGLGLDNAVYVTRQTEAGSNSWTGWQGLGGWLASPPAAAYDGFNNIQVFAPGGDAQLYSYQLTDVDPNNRQLGGWVGRGGGPIVGDVAAIGTVGWVSVFARRTDNKIYGTNVTTLGRWDLWRSLGEGGLTTNPIVAGRGRTITPRRSCSRSAPTSRSMPAGPSASATAAGSAQ
jgi:hypothetical protein